MRYTIAQEVFQRYPGFMRAVIIAENIDNNTEQPELAAQLAACEKHVCESMGEDFKEHPRLAPWAEAFRSMSINPNKYPPSVVNLVKRARSGKALPYVNSLVAAFNCISLGHLCPCGGDDLAAVHENLLLAPAKGDERYVPLGQPDVTEHPPAGEIIYMDTASKEVFCRAWCWKNGDSSKLLPTTKRAAINIDIMPPMTAQDAKSIAEELREMLFKYTGAKTTVYYLDQDNPEFTF